MEMLHPIQPSSVDYYSTPKSTIPVIAAPPHPYLHQRPTSILLPSTSNHLRPSNSPTPLKPAPPPTPKPIPNLLKKPAF